MYINCIIKLRRCIRKESKKRRKWVYNVYLVAKLTGTVLYTDRVAVLAGLGRIYRYYKYRTAVKVLWSY